MLKKGLWILFASSAILVGIYPSIYFFIDRKFGLLSTKSSELLSNTYWNIGFYSHIILAGVALLLGWTQFNSTIRKNNIELHKAIGKTYVLAALVSAIGSIYIGFFATGGIISSAGFICLGTLWFVTTLMGYVNIRNKQINEHQKMMIYSYAACFAGVTLRMWLPVLTFLTGDGAMAYKIVAWLCWVPNLTVAYIISRRITYETMAAAN